MNRENNQSETPNVGAETTPAKTPWYDVRHWTLGDWGSAASILGVGFYLFDQFRMPIVRLKTPKGK